ncbi:hypothetical protein [Rhodocyclus tenuis]|uniref:hypothetical protein n=1 Tax=Rhodocyclus tenuis TaxID=1066 RepID=UPI001904B477|nr:hypothetical protein [Rhodocyclus tenuis]MBK1679313.1 hypothetical protein [Rhodocyclus tenuis]
MKKLRLVPTEATPGMLEAGGSAGAREQMKTGSMNTNVIYRAMLAAAPEPPRQKPVAYLKKNEAMGLIKVDMYPYFDAWMAPSSAWSVSPLYLHPAEDELLRLREQRDSLLAALRDCSSLVEGNGAGRANELALEKARAAIAKALSGQHR